MQDQNQQKTPLLQCERNGDFKAYGLRVWPWKVPRVPEVYQVFHVNNEYQKYTKYAQYQL